MDANERMDAKEGKMKFRNKPVVIDALQWTGRNLLDCGDFMGGESRRNVTWGHGGNKLFIQTLEGIMTASPGDWIIKGVNGEFYPCNPDIFAATYELVDQVIP